MKKLLVLFGLTLATPAALALAMIPCVRDGETASVGELLPTLGPGSGTGLPTSAQWTPADAQAMDSDGWSPDDFLGFAPPSPTGTVSVDVTASGGHLWANGQKIDSGLEGTCIEVYFRKAYTYSASTSGCLGVSSGGVSGKVCSETQISITSFYDTKPQKVCPC
jgi:hypothetical protein